MNGHRNIETINPLCNPLHYGDTLLIGAHTYRIDSSMRGIALTRDDGTVIARDLGQAEAIKMLIDMERND